METAENNANIDDTVKSRTGTFEVIPSGKIFVISFLVFNYITKLVWKYEKVRVKFRL